MIDDILKEAAGAWKTVDGKVLASPLERQRDILLKIRAVLEARLVETQRVIEVEKMRRDRMKHGGGF